MLTTHKEQELIAARFVDVWQNENVCGEWDYSRGLVALECEHDAERARELAEKSGVKIRFIVETLVCPLRFAAFLLAGDVADEIGRIRCHDGTPFDSALDDVLTGGDWTPIENVWTDRNLQTLDVEAFAEYVLTADFVGEETAQYARRGVELARKYGLNHWQWSLHAARELGRILDEKTEQDWPEWALHSFCGRVLQADPMVSGRETANIRRECLERENVARCQVRCNATAENLGFPDDMQAALEQEFERLDAIEQQVSDRAELIDFN